LVTYFVTFVCGFAYLPGTDAYYYALQTQSILDSGHPKVADHGLAYYLIAAASRLGFSIETAFRISLTLVFTVYQVAMAMLVSRVKGIAQSLAVLVWAFSAPVLAFHTIEFPNLTLAIATVPAWFWLLLKPIRNWRFWTLLLVSASALVHAAAAALALLFGGALILEVLLADDHRSARRLPRQLVPVLAISAAVVVALIIAYIGIKRHLFPFTPGMPALLRLVLGTDVPKEMTLTLVSLWLVLAVLLIRWWRECSARWRFLSVGALALPWWPNDSDGLAGLGARLSVLFVLLALPLIATVWSETAGNKPFLSWVSGQSVERSIVLGIVVALFLVPLRVHSYRQLLAADDYSAYEKVITTLRGRNIPMLIAHRGLDFFYTYRLKRDAFHFDPEPEWDRRQTWRIAAQITPEEMAFYSPVTCPWGETATLLSGTDYLLVREDCWEKFRSRLNRTDNPDLYTVVCENSENPSHPRPSFLRNRHTDRPNHADYP